MRGVIDEGKRDVYRHLSMRTWSVASTQEDVVVVVDFGFALHHERHMRMWIRVFLFSMRPTLSGESHQEWRVHRETNLQSRVWPPRPGGNHRAAQGVCD